jgi:hypothetical protein
MPFGIVAKHARRTGDLLAEAVWARDRVLKREGLGPKDQVATTREALEQTSGDVMIVGHLPFLGKLVALLVTGSEENEIVEYQVGSIVCIERRRRKIESRLDDYARCFTADCLGQGTYLNIGHSNPSNIVRAALTRTKTGPSSVRTAQTSRSTSGALEHLLGGSGNADRSV